MTDLERLLSQSPVWQKLYATNAEYRLAWDEGRGPGQALQSSTPPTIRVATNHWFEFHEYAFKHRLEWDADAALAYFCNWEKRIPNTSGCACRKKWMKIRIPPPPFPTPESFLKYSYECHSLVNSELGKPFFSWAECSARWFSDSNSESE